MKKYQFSKEKYLRTPANAAIYKANKWRGEMVDDIDGKLVTLDAEGIGMIGGTYIHISWCEEVPESVDFMTAINSGKRIRHESWTVREFDTVKDALMVIASKCPSVAKEMLNGKWYIEC